MTLKYEIHSGKRILKFDTATDLDKFLIKGRTTKVATILVFNEHKSHIGTLTVEKYKQFQKLFE